MKRYLISLALLTFGFAQKTFTQVTLKEMLEEYKRVSKAFFSNRLSQERSIQLFIKQKMQKSLYLK